MQTWHQAAQGGCNWSFLWPVVVMLQRGATFVGTVLYVEEKLKAVAQLDRQTGDAVLLVNGVEQVRGDAFDVGTAWYAAVDFNQAGFEADEAMLPLPASLRDAIRATAYDVTGGVREAVQ